MRSREVRRVSNDENDERRDLELLQFQIHISNFELTDRDFLSKFSTVRS